MPKAPQRFSISRLYRHMSESDERVALSRAEELFARLCVRAYLADNSKMAEGSSMRRQREENEGSEP